MRVLRWVAAAFSLFSQIPVVHFKMNEDDMAHAVMFLPLIGLVIAVAEYYVNLFADIRDFPVFVKCLLFLLIPLLITGGFHVDGFLDTMDAHRSYMDKDKKLEILSDPHIGAFSVITLITAGLSAAAGIGIIMFKGDRNFFNASILVFAAARALAGLTSVRLPKARRSGMLYEETKKDNSVIFYTLLFWLVSVAGFMTAVSPFGAAICLPALAAFTLYYKKMTMTDFGGVTGDTAGYFVTAATVVGFDSIAVAAMIFGG